MKENLFLKKLLTFPTWIIVRIIIPFLPKKHAWYKRYFTLSDWAIHSTPLNNIISLNYWFCGIITPFIIYKLIELCK